MEEKYFKNVLDLTATELAKIYNAEPDCEYPPPIPRFDKTGMVMNLLSLNKDLLADTDKKYFFKKTGKEVEYLSDYSGDDCQQRFARADHKIDPEKIKKALMLSDIDSVLKRIKEEETDDGPKQQTTTGGTQTSDKQPDPKVNRADSKSARPGPEPTQAGSTSSHESNRSRNTLSSSMRIKSPKYDSSLPISAWIRNMEIYGRASSLNDQELITTALSSLLSEEEGSHVISSLTDVELQNWQLFKNKLEDVLGHTRDHWKFLYENYQRGSDSFGVAMSKLTSYYRQGYEISELRKHDQELLIERFCKCQDDRMRELLLREKANLNVSTIVKRANELERSLPQRENLFAISAPAENEKIAKQLVTLTEEIQRLKISNSSNEKKPTLQKKRAKIDLDKAAGYCIKFTQGKMCRYGDACKYLHASDPPKSVVDYAKSLL